MSDVQGEPDIISYLINMSCQSTELLCLLLIATFPVGCKDKNVSLLMQGLAL